MSAEGGTGLPSVRIVNAGGGMHDTRVYLNGELVPALRRYALEQKAGDIPVLVLEVYPGIVDVELPGVVLAALDASRTDDRAPEFQECGKADSTLMRLASGVSEDADEADEMLRTSAEGGHAS